MWQCRKCGRPVYFAERKQSLGFDWHPKCLRCEECGKRLNPGQHAEHKGVPYCHHPCYGALFGPQLFGHGTRNECHTSFGKVENRDGQVKRSHIEAKLKAYNQYYEGKPGELKSREANGRMILEGVLKIYWGVRNVIHLKEEDDQRTIAVRRRSTANSTAFYSDSDDEEQTLWREDCLNGWRTPQSPSSPQTPKVNSLGRHTLPCIFLSDQLFHEREGSRPLTPVTSTEPIFSSTREDGVDSSNKIYSQADRKDQTQRETKADLGVNGDVWKNTVSNTCCNLITLLDAECGNTTKSTNGVVSVREETSLTPKSVTVDISSTNTKVKNMSPDVTLNNNPLSPSFESPTDGENRDSSVVENNDSGELNTSLDDQTPSRRAAAMKTGSSAIRRRPGRRMDKTKLKRRCSINGHFYLRETSTFTPPHGSPCSVWVTSLVTAEEVLNMLLEKYRVEMSTRNFALFVIKDNGERRRIRDDEYPLITRVMLGPHEDVARVFIVDAQQTEEISPQVAQFLNLSLAECRAILQQYEQEERRQILAVKQKYEDMAFYIQRRMKELRGV
ncbi:ras association domain-containing protein 2-like [Homarus americanus]|uniref:ras association domain-containing protein 2-like n=1 Tax=Homarus americanus TaxID=6706 RepID=UPI001C496F78|nr:ras association domain-containing protein 2-like [Homarus americanus]